MLASSEKHRYLVSRCELYDIIVQANQIYLSGEIVGHHLRYPTTELITVLFIFLKEFLTSSINPPF